MKKLFKHLNGYKKECVLGPLFKLLEASFELLVPFVVAEIIDIAIPSGNKSYLLYMCLALVGLGIVGFVCAVTAQFFAAKAACGFAKDLKRSLFSHLQTLSFTELDELGSSTMITRMTSDTNQLQTGVNMAIRLLLRSPFVVFGAMIMAFIIDVKAGIIFAIAIPVLAIVVFAIILGCIPLYRRLQNKLDSVLQRTRENLAGARVVRAFNLQESEIEAFEKENEELSKRQKFVGGISALMNPLTLVILNLAIIALVYVGAIRVDVGILTQGAVFALYNYMSQILIELIKLANLIVTLTKAIACGKRVSQVFDIQSSMQNGDKILEQNALFKIEFKNVSMQYKNSGADSLEDISFTVEKGQTVGIIGGTGCGKTTLINLIARFYDVKSGEVLIDGVNVKEYDTQSLRDTIGIVPQKAVLFKGSIKDNLKWRNKNATDEEIEKAIEIAQAKDVVKSKGGLDAIVEQNGANFSGGQKQRLTIARALIGSPKILILDDCASALDFATEARLRKALKKQGKDKTIFIVSQRASSIMHADKIIVLEDGKMVGLGTHDELLKSCKEYRETYQMQNGVEVVS